MTTNKRTKAKVCPRCEQHYSDYPALSRRDNKTDICPRCGEMEALEDAGFVRKYAGRQYWKDE